MKSINEFFYSSIYYQDDEIFLKGYYQDGRPLKGKFEFQPHLYVRGKDKNCYKSFQGEDLKRKEFNNFKEIKTFVESNECYGLGISSKRISKRELPYTFIVDTFKEEISYNFNYIGILNIDIETTSNTFPDYKNPQEEILLITCSLLRNNKRTYKTFGCRKSSYENYDYFESESEMLKAFCQYVKDSNIDIITSWYGQRFDIPYIFARISKKYDEEWLRLLSPFGIMPKMIHKKTKNRKTASYEEYDVIEIPGISDLDYMKLYNKFNTYGGSLALDNIAYLELGEKKLDYSEYGSMKNFYEIDFDKFVHYNVKDVILVDKLIDKLKYIELIVSIAYLCKTYYEDAIGSVKVWDNLLFDYLLNHRKVIIPLKKSSEKLAQNIGGRVKESKIGMSEYVITTDATSLYPSIMISLNISPETFIKKLEIKEDKMLDMSYNTSYLKDKKYSLACNGCLFDISKQGVLAHLVEDIFNKRVYYKNLMKLEKKKEDCDELLLSKYDVFQYALKIMINSAYGVFSSESFRFYDIDLAEAITVTGQTIIQLSDKTINNFLNSYLKNKTNKDYVIFSDTDSCAIELKEIINLYKPENPIDFLDKFYNDNIDPILTEVFDEFSNYSNFYKNNISFKREKIIEKIVITAKKRYASLVWDDEGYRYKEPKIIVKGLEIVRTNISELIKERLNKALEIILKGNEEELQKYVLEFKNEFRTFPVEEISQNMGVNDLKKYSNSKEGFELGTPSHVKASICHNNLIKSKKLQNEIELIKDSDKVKIILLKQPNSIFNDRFAYKNNFDKRFGLDKYIDYNKMFQNFFIEPLDRILKCVNWSYEKQENFSDLI